MPVPKTKIIKYKKFAWHNTAGNGEPEIRYLKRHFDFKNSHLTDCANPPLRPKIECADDYVFLVLLFPVYNPKTGVVSITELDIFANQNYVVTVGGEKVNAVKDIAQKAADEPAFRKKYENASSLNFLLDVVEAAVSSLPPMLNHIAWDIDAIETELFSGQERKLVSRILAIKRNIVAMAKAARTQKYVFEKLQKCYPSYFGGAKAGNRFEQLIAESRTIWRELRTHQDTINAIQESNESFIAFRQSDIMKTLTMFSVIVFPLTLFAAIFSMRAEDGMPFLGDYGFWKVIGIMVLIAVFMFTWFKRKKWL